MVATNQKTADELPVGVHEGVKAGIYHALPFASASRLNKLARSAMHMRHEFLFPSQPGPDFVIGSAAHSLVLEPSLFELQYAIAPECDRRTKDGKAIWADFCDRSSGRTLLTAEQFSQAGSIAAAVNSHPAAKMLLAARMATEVSAVWRCGTTGVKCKLRADMLCDLGDGNTLIVDLKTTRDASRTAFERSIFNFGYAIQASHYLAGLAAHGRIFESFAFICVEKEPPYAVAVYRLEDEVLAAVHSDRIRLLNQWKRCHETNKFPGYGDGMMDISVPTWALRQMEQEEVA